MEKLKQNQGLRVRSRLKSGDCECTQQYHFITKRPNGYICKGNGVASRIYQQGTDWRVMDEWTENCSKGLIKN